MIYNKYHKSIDNKKIKANIGKKFAIKGLDFKSIDDFFDPAYISVVTDEWDQWLKPFVKDLPPAELVLKDMKERILPSLFF